jgi:hypothetical protein
VPVLGGHLPQRPQNRRLAGKGITVLEKIKPEDLDKMLLQVKGIASLTGKDTNKIKVILNKK